MGGGICSTHFLLSPTQQEEGSKETRREQKGGDREKEKTKLFSSLSFQGCFMVLTHKRRGARKQGGTKGGRGEN